MITGCIVKLLALSFIIDRQTRQKLINKDGDILMETSKQIHLNWLFCIMGFREDYYMHINTDRRSLHLFYFPRESLPSQLTFS